MGWNLHDFFGFIREMLFDLIVAEFEDLELIRERRLSSLSLSEVVDDLAIREGLLDVLVVEVDDCVSVWERFAFDAVVKNDLFFTVLVDSLDLSVMTNILLDYLLVLKGFAVILFRKSETEVFFLVRSSGSLASST